MKGLAALVLLQAAALAPLAAQERVAGIVMDSATHAPLDKARVRIEGGATGVTDRFGRFVLTTRFPARLIVARIGSRPDTLLLTEAPSDLVRITLLAAPIQIADLVVEGERDLDPALGSFGRWTVPKDGGGAPAIVARDVLRDLAATPAVTQSTLLSVRPLIRGYDAGEVTLLLDGFDLPTPYHLARAFSALPTEAVEQTSVRTAPLDPSIGGTTGAAVDSVGRVGGGGPGERGGVGLTPVSIDAWLGGGRTVRGFLAGRVTTITSAARLAGRRLPYGFKDAYGSAVFAPGGLPRVRVTGFLSRDSAGESSGDQWMRWGTSLLGARADAWRGRTSRFEVSAHYSAFDEVVNHIAISSAVIDVKNDFSRLGLGLEWSRAAGRSRAVIGLAPGWRHIINRVAASGSDLATTDQDVRVGELGAYAAYSHAVGTAQVDWGLRVDRAGENTAWQPRVRAAIPVGREVTLEAGVGRSARLYHSITDPRSMPEIVFYELWLEAGKNGVPMARIDHYSVAATWRRGGASLRGTLYASRGRGIVELRPETDQQVAPAEYRIGEARTSGLEAQAGWSGERSALTASYALTWSERDWGAGWIRWRQDRRHLFRLAAQTERGAWRLSALGEFQSAAPLTPVDHIADGTVPDPGSGTPFPRAVLVYGRENSANGAPTFRTDLGLERRFHGPWGSRGALTLSVTNLSFGPLAPIGPVKPTDVGFDPANGAQYQRLFEMPAIPSFGLRFEF